MYRVEVIFLPVCLLVGDAQLRVRRKLRETFLDVGAKEQFPCIGYVRYFIGIILSHHGQVCLVIRTGRIIIRYFKRCLELLVKACHALAVCILCDLAANGSRLLWHSIAVNNFDCSVFIVGNRHIAHCRGRSFFHPHSARNGAIDIHVEHRLIRQGDCIDCDRRRHRACANHCPVAVRFRVCHETNFNIGLIYDVTVSILHCFPGRRVKLRTDIHIVIRKAEPVDILGIDLVLRGILVAEVSFIDGLQITCPHKGHLVNRRVGELLRDDIFLCLILFQAERHIGTVAGKYGSSGAVRISCGINLCNRLLQVLDDCLSVLSLFVVVVCRNNIIPDIVRQNLVDRRDG